MLAGWSVCGTLHLFFRPRVVPIRGPQLQAKSRAFWGVFPSILEGPSCPVRISRLRYFGKNKEQAPGATLEGYYSQSVDSGATEIYIES